MFPHYTMHTMNPGGLPPYSMFPYMSMPTFPSQAPMSAPLNSPDVNVTCERDCATPDGGNTSACSSDCSSGYSSLDSTRISPPFQSRNFQPGPFPFYPTRFQFWPQTPPLMTGFSQSPRVPTPEGVSSSPPNNTPYFTQGYSPRTDSQTVPYPGWMVPYGFAPRHMIPPRMSTPESTCSDASFISPIPSDSTSTPERHIPLKRAGRTQKGLSAAALKSQRAFAMLELIVDLLMDETNKEIIEWIATNSLEFTIRDRKKFIAHWNKISGKMDSFMALSCIMRAVGNDKVMTRSGEKVRLITRTAAYTYRFFPDHDLPSLPMLRDDDLQRLLTKMLLSFHLHLRKNKKVAESAVFQPLMGYPLFTSFAPPPLPKAGSNPEQSDPEKT